VSDAKRDCIHWHPVCTVEKYSPDQAAWARRKLPARQPLHGDLLRELFRVPEGGIIRAEGNGVTAAWLANLAQLLTGAGGYPLAPGRTVFGVGIDGETEFSPSLVHLAPGPGEGFGRSWYRPMDPGFPAARGGTVAGQATFGEREACHIWAEWCWAAGRAGAVAGPVLRECFGGEGEHVMLNRKAPEGGFGDKETGAAWVFQTEITFRDLLTSEGSVYHRWCSARRVTE
jgi:hypothetical protein